MDKNGNKWKIIGDYFVGNPTKMGVGNRDKNVMSSFLVVFLRKVPKSDTPKITSLR